MWDMTRVTYIVTLKLSQSFKDKRCEGLKPKLYRGHVEVHRWSFKIQWGVNFMSLKVFKKKKL